MRRMEQINDLLQRKLAEMFSTDIEIPSEFFITITKVECAKNLKDADVWFSVLPFNQSEEALKFVIRIRKEIQRKLGDIINLQFTPRLHYHIDETEQTADEIYQTLDKINEQERDK
ncbi:MAG: ribosome-binding factor A [Parcubacteria group bacterium]